MKLRFKTGFGKLVMRDIIINVGTRAVIHPQLKLGKIDAVITVNAETPLVDTAASSLGTVVDQQSIQSLPLNGRNFTDLALLTPKLSSRWVYCVRGDRTIHAVGHIGKTRHTRALAYNCNQRSRTPKGARDGGDLDPADRQTSRQTAVAEWSQLGPTNSKRPRPLYPSCFRQ